MPPTRPSLPRCWNSSANVSPAEIVSNSRCGGGVRRKPLISVKRRHNEGSAAGGKNRVMRSHITRAVVVTAAGAALGLAALGAACAAAAPASGIRPARVVTAYVVNGGDGTVTPINTATNKPGRAIRLPPAGDDHHSLPSIGVPPDGRTA